MRCCEGRCGRAEPSSPLALLAAAQRHCGPSLPLSGGILLQCSSCCLVALALEQKTLIPNMGLTLGTWRWISCPVPPVLGSAQQLWARSFQCWHRKPESSSLPRLSKAWLGMVTQTLLWVGTDPASSSNSAVWQHSGKYWNTGSTAVSDRDGLGGELCN